MSLQELRPLSKWVPAVLALGTAACYQGPVARFYTLQTPKWKAGAALRFLILSDLHGACFGKAQHHLLERVRRARPDYILLPGDIFDERFSFAAASLLLNGLTQVAPVYYALGNHEYRTHQLGKLLSIVRQAGATALLDQYRMLDTAAGPLAIAGCEDSEKRLYTRSYQPFSHLPKAFAPLDGWEGYTVLLGHRPERVGEYAALGLDLVVSGHAHGGQWRVPYLLNGVFAPNQGLFPPYAGGCYHHRAMRHVVSRGLSVFPGLPRVWNPPEITVVDVTGSK